MAGRLIWLSVGLFAVALGILGAVLPLLPTTPFLLVAAYAFARSSQTLHDWLVEHPRLGPPIRDWREKGAIRRGTKVVSVLTMVAAFGVSVLAGFGTTVLLTQALILTAVAVFLLTRPSP